MANPDVTTSTTSLGNRRLAVGDLCWHYQHGLLSERVITEVRTSALDDDHPDYVLGYHINEAEPFGGTDVFVPEGRIFARPEERERLEKQIEGDIWLLQVFLAELRGERTR